jgi:hypothetical protein
VNKVIASSSEMKDHPVMMINMHRWMESLESEQYTHLMSSDVGPNCSGSSASGHTMQDA